MPTGAPDFSFSQSAQAASADVVDPARTRLETLAVSLGLAPDLSLDRIRALGDVAQDGLGQLCVATAVPGAGVVQSAREVISNSTTRATIFTPTSGNRIRIISVQFIWENNTAINAEAYFGTGANIGSDETKAISNVRLDQVRLPPAPASWQDGAGPVGSVDDVVSMRATAAIVADLTLLIHFRQE